MDKKLLGRRIREARKSRKLTQEKLAERADMGATYLGEIERGLKSPGVEILIKIADALCVPVDYLIRDGAQSGKPFVYDELTKKLDGLTPKQRQTAADILDAYIRNLK